MKYIPLLIILCSSCSTSKFHEPEEEVVIVEEIKIDSSIVNIKNAYSELYKIDNAKYGSKHMVKAFNQVATEYRTQHVNFDDKKKQVFFNKLFSVDHIRFALLEQDKYGIPASITLAQAYLESKKSGLYEFSDHVKHTNNYFGIKYHNNKLIDKPYKFDTTENFTDAQYQRLKKSGKKYSYITKKNGKHVVRIKSETFAAFTSSSPVWKNFRLHSQILNRYKIKECEYDSYARRLCKTRYATSDQYGELLITIIKRHHLDFLDHCKS